MPILTDSPTLAKCPKCGCTGPYNFRLEQRASLKRPDPTRPDIYNLLSAVTVYACVKCGAVASEING